MKLLEVREKMKQKPNFDLAKFHDFLLFLGPVPLELLEQEVLEKSL